MQERVDALASSLSDHCLACESSCCRTGRILLQPKDEPLFKNKNVRADGLVIVELAGGCEHLSNGRCAIYENRPDVCRHYPLFLRHKTLFVAESCPAVKQGLLDKELASLQRDFPELRVIRQ
ncbi:YkgJ family cysteine cluster protein [Candidatus Woesearchaeota archaeon]|nr:YkgJ family cysteine cluster protein [Candidatus Woesearchaeota archaeon]